MSEPVNAELASTQTQTLGVDRDISADTVRTLEPLQRAALWSALGIGVLIAAISIPLIVGWLLQAPQPPQLAGLDDAATKRALDTYRELVQIHESAAQGRFDTIVLKALLPILTLTLGYVFGSQAKRD